jgi:hypothetical protein
MKLEARGTLRTWIIDAVRVARLKAVREGDWKRWDKAGKVLRRFRAHDEQREAANA